MCIRDRTGRYDISGRAFYRTISPSMDILISSNLERLLFELCGRDPKQVRGWMEALRTGSRYDIGNENLCAMRAVFAGGFTDDAGTREEIRRTYAEDGYLMDPHTAVASHVLRAYQEQTGDRTPSVIVSTASPYKFGRPVLEAIAGTQAAEGLDAVSYTHLRGTGRECRWRCPSRRAPCPRRTRSAAWSGIGRHRCRCIQF